MLPIKEEDVCVFRKEPLHEGVGSYEFSPAKLVAVINEMREAIPESGVKDGWDAAADALKKPSTDVGWEKKARDRFEYWGDHEQIITFFKDIIKDERQNILNEVRIWGKTQIGANTYHASLEPLLEELEQTLT